MKSSRVVVPPVFCMSDFLVRDFRKIAAFRKKTSENPVVVLVCSPFAGCVRMSEINFCPRFTVDATSLDSLDVHKLCSAITSQRYKNSTECLASDFTLNFVQNINRAFSFGIRHLFHNLVAAFI